MYGLFGFGELALPAEEEDEDDKLPDTVRTPKLATLVVEDKACILFTSADYTLEAKAGDVVIERSTTIANPHTEPFKKRWVRQMIRMNAKRLTNLGVDVETAYLSWGGLAEDLVETG